MSRESCSREEYQCAHGAVQSMSMVPPELGICALQRRVSVRLRLLDSVRLPLLVYQLHVFHALWRVINW